MKLLFVVHVRVFKGSVVIYAPVFLEKRKTRSEHAYYMNYKWMLMIRFINSSVNTINIMLTISVKQITLNFTFCPRLPEQVTRWHQTFGWMWRRPRIVGRYRRSLILRRFPLPRRPDAQRLFLEMLCPPVISSATQGIVLRE